MNEFVIKNGFISKGDGTVNNDLTVLGDLNVDGNTSYLQHIDVQGRAIMNVVTGTTTSGLTIDWQSANNFEYTISADTTISFTNDVNGQTIILAIKQDSTSGNTITWPSEVKWAGGSEPTQTATANSIDIYTIIKVTNNYYGSYIQDFQ